jgi:hypothetical protein
MELELSIVTISLAAAMERADEANNSLGAVNTLQMKSEITIPSVRCMVAQEALVLWSIHVEGLLLCQS